jgi:N-acetylglutamate synthase-like GNAT family acetyltransferase
VALLEAEGLPASDLTEEHLEHFFFTGTVRALYLLTTTAETYFEHRGYRRIDRADAPPSIQSTREFASLCPSNSAFMIKRL